jgi:hypothetical protein
MESIVMQAMAEKEWLLANAMIEILRDFSAQKKVEEKNGNDRISTVQS